MSLRIRQLHLRVQTGEGLYGTRIAFENGLVILRAENTMGKSTCVQAIIYALGLERMLGPQNEIPLPHVMTTYIQDGDREIEVLESEVLLEIENQRGQFLTIRRGVVGQTDTRLVNTWDGARLTNPAGAFVKTDYFARDAGAAQNIAGFQRKIADFVGWELPNVRRYNGSECPLYLEAICPLFIVEQKRGWAGIQANIPTYFSIRDVAKRCVEFVLNLDCARYVEESQRLEQTEIELKNQWKNYRNLAVSSLKSINGRIVGLPEHPSAQWPLSMPPQVEVFRSGEWHSFEDAIATDRRELNLLELAPIRTAGESAAMLATQLDTALQSLAKSELFAGEHLDQIQLERLHLESIELRLVALSEDRRRNKDAQKLRSFGSDAGISLDDSVCPTCHQDMADTLLPQSPIEHPMSIEENITFIESQIRTFKNLGDNSRRLIERKEIELEEYKVRIGELRTQIRSLRQTLLSANSTPTIETVRLRIAIESRIRMAEIAVEDYEVVMESLSEVASDWQRMLLEKKSRPTGALSFADTTKLSSLRALFQEQLRDFQFSSLDVDTLEISPDSYRPTREGFHLGFDLSASDNIRTIWAYLQGLLELSSIQNINHLGLLLFDEPRQQEAASLSFQQLLARASSSKARGQQVIFATSEPLSNVQAMTNDLDVQLISYEGRMVSRLD